MIPALVVLALTSFPLPFLASARDDTPTEASAAARSALTLSRRLDPLANRVTSASNCFSSIGPLLPVHRCDLVRDSTRSLT